MSFSFYEWLATSERKNNSQRVTKAHLDSPRVISGKAISDKWESEWALSDVFGNYFCDFPSA